MWEKISLNLIWFVIRLWTKTLRFRVVNAPLRLQCQQLHPTGMHINCLWHEELIPVLLACAHNQTFYAPMTSLSKDGDIISFILEKFSFPPVRGSSSRGGKEARMEMEISMMQKNIAGAITLDGPRGPRRMPHGGAIHLAKKLQVPLLPMIALCERPFIFKKSWDQTKIPLPFSRIILAYVSPFMVGANDPVEALKAKRHHLKEAMEDMEKTLLEQKIFSRWNELKKFAPHLPFEKGNL